MLVLSYLPFFDGCLVTSTVEDDGIILGDLDLGAGAQMLLCHVLQTQAQLLRNHLWVERVGEWVGERVGC